MQSEPSLDEKERLRLDALCPTLSGGNMWIKLSASYRCSNQFAPGDPKLQWLVRRLVHANPK
jgi:hypothetical protein